MCNANELKCLCVNLPTILLILLNINNGCIGLRDLKVIVPPAVELGKRAILECRFDQESDPLYSLKWYKNGREFFRFTPHDEPIIKYFPIQGLYVSLNSSNSTHVVVEQVTVNSSGEFSCEVTMDAPSFYTKVDYGSLEVVILPSHDPHISGLKTRYRLDETLKANCTSKDSRPAANLTWLVNGNPVKPDRIRRHKAHESIDGNLFSARLGLKLPLTKQLFAKGRLKIRCVASIHSIYYRSSEKSVELERQKPRYYYTTPKPLPTIPWESIIPPEHYPEVIIRPSTSGSATTHLIYNVIIVLLITILTKR